MAICRNFLLFHDAVSKGEKFSMDFSVLKDCCKRHILASTGLEPIFFVIAVRNTPHVSLVRP
jgi:hypothetical protein